MSNGLGIGFFAITLLAVLASLAILVVLVTIASVMYHRRTGHIPTLLQYLLVVICVCVLVVAGFGILLLYDEAPAAAWLFTSIVVFPFSIVNIYLARTTELSRFDVITMMVLAWSVPFFLGVVVVFGVMNGIASVFDLAPAESRWLDIAWIAAAVWGLTIILNMMPIATRLGRVSHSANASQERV